MGIESSTEIKSKSAGAPRVGDLLISYGLISQDQLEEALEVQKKSGFSNLLGEVLVELGYVTDVQVSMALADEYGVPFVRLTGALVDHGIVDILPLEFLEENAILPMFYVSGVLTLAVIEPSNVFLFEEVKKKLNCRVQLVATTPLDLKEQLTIVKQKSKTIELDSIVAQQGESVSLVETPVEDLVDSVESADDSPVIKLVNAIVLSAVQDGASDIHIEPDEGVLRVRFRIDGRLHEKMKPPYSMAGAIIARIKIMASMDISERRLPQDGGISVQVESRRVDLRVSTIPGKFGEKACLRVIDKRDGVVGLPDLGIPNGVLDKWQQLIRKPNGIVLVTGPTGSGKSTTLYSTLSEIASESVNISTVEDPVEYNILGVNQFQTNNKAGFTFAKALRSLLRQDPDIVMVGEIRDEETARISVQAALTGHLVFSTLHTNDAPSAVTRLLNIGVEPYLIAATVQGVLAQRLVRKVCERCSVWGVPDPNLNDLLLTRVDKQYVPEAVKHAVGCKHCRSTGFKGRIGLYELFQPSTTTMRHVCQADSVADVMQELPEEEYNTLLQSGLEQVGLGNTTLEEVLAVV